MRKPVMFRCDYCGEFHPTDIMRVCSDPTLTFTRSELDRTFHPAGWIENRRINPKEFWTS